MKWWIGKLPGAMILWAISAQFAAADPATPDVFALSQNYPNPFNSSTVLRYILPAAADVRIEIYDITGRKLKTLVDSRQGAGLHSVLWAPDDITSGVYFYKLTAGDIAETRPMIFLK